MTGGRNIPRQEPAKTQHKARSHRHRDCEPRTRGFASKGADHAQPKGSNRGFFLSPCAGENRAEDVLGIGAGLPQIARDRRHAEEAADSGPIDWYNANCVKHTYNAGDSWTEGTTLHDVVNHSSVDAHFVVTYVVAKGANKRTDQSAPACAAAPGLM
jgi:hypothetical protein